DDASEIAAMVDRELTNLANILTALSTTYYLQADDLQGFYRQATEVAQRIGIRITLRDANTGMQLFNTSTPWSAPLSSYMGEGRVRLEEEVAKLDEDSTFRARISNVFYSESLKEFRVVVGVPIRRNGVHAYTLTIGIPAANFARVLDSRQAPSGWVLTV